VTLLCAGLVLRILVEIGYRPALEFYGDSMEYLHEAGTLQAPTMHTAGYPIFLALFRGFGSLTLVTMAQHLLLLCGAVGLYVVLVRMRVRPWLAALGVAPLMLDGYQLAIEHFILAEAVTEALLIAGFVALLWRTQPRIAACTASGFLLAAAGLARTVVLPLLLVGLAYLVLRRVGWRALTGFVTAAAVPVLGYCAWFAASTGHFGLDEFSGIWLYGRVGQFASCAGITVPPIERGLCPRINPAHRPGSNFYVWNPRSPLRTVPGDSLSARSGPAGDFARRVIRHQFGTYLGVALGDTAHYFLPGHPIGARDWPVGSWRFPTGAFRKPRFQVTVAEVGFDGRVTSAGPLGLRRALHDYQTVAYTPGPLLAACLLAALVAGAGLVRHRRPTAEQRQRAGALLLAVSGLVVVAAPSLAAGFDYRYGLLMLPFLPPAGALAVQSLAARGRGRDEEADS
jgi:hypothetical protein